jgi:hypothetical protein
MQLHSVVVARGDARRVGVGACWAEGRRLDPGLVDAGKRRSAGHSGVDAENERWEHTQTDKGRRSTSDGREASEREECESGRAGPF